MDVFKSKIDRSLLICLILSVFACMLGASVMLKIGGAVNFVIAAFILIVGAGFPLWILISTRYAVQNGNLEIMSGPFSWSIPIHSIKAIQESQSALTSPALSFDRLEVNYDEDKVILVSPADKKRFLQKLDIKDSVSLTLDRKARKHKEEKVTQNNSQKNEKNVPNKYK